MPSRLSAEIDACVVSHSQSLPAVSGVILLSAINAILLSAGKPRDGRLIEARLIRASGAAPDSFSRGLRNASSLLPGTRAVASPLSFCTLFGRRTWASWQHGLRHSPPVSPVAASAPVRSTPGDTDQMPDFGSEKLFGFRLPGRTVKLCGFVESLVIFVESTQSAVSQKSWQMALLLA